MSLDETIRNIAGKPLPANEEMVKFFVLARVLEDLGWDVHDSTGNLEVEFERAVGPGRGAKQTGRSDIALMDIRGKRRSVCLIEVKAPSRKLEEHVDQLIGYAFHEGVDLCVLTNAKSWWLYLPRAKGQPQDCRFAEVEITDSPEQVAAELQLFLEKKNVLSGDALERAQQRLKARQDRDHLEAEVPRVWEGMLSSPDQELISLVSKRVSEQTGLHPSPEQVAALLTGKEVERPAIPSVPSSVKPDVPTRKPPTKVIAYTLWGTRHGVRTSIDVLVGVAEALYQRYPNNFPELEAEMKGKRWNLLSRDITSLGGTSRQIGNSPYHIYVALSAVDIRKRSERLLEHFGHSSSDLRIEYVE